MYLCPGTEYEMHDAYTAYVCAQEETKVLLFIKQGQIVREFGCNVHGFTIILVSKVLIHLPRIHYQGHWCIYDQMMNHFVLWKYGYGGLRLINSRISWRSR